jgi:nitroreductase
MVAENLMLQTTALGLGGTPVGAFDAGEVRAVIDPPEAGPSSATARASTLHPVKLELRVSV